MSHVCGNIGKINLQVWNILMRVNNPCNILSMKGILFSSLLLFGCARSVIAQEWTQITPLVANAPAVVEFFPFIVLPVLHFPRRSEWTRPYVTYCRQRWDVQVPHQSVGPVWG